MLRINGNQSFRGCLCTAHSALHPRRTRRRPGRNCTLGGLVSTSSRTKKTIYGIIVDPEEIMRNLGKRAIRKLVPVHSWTGCGLSGVPLFWQKVWIVIGSQLKIRGTLGAIQTTSPAHVLFNRSESIPDKCRRKMKTAGTFSFHTHVDTDYTLSSLDTQARHSRYKHRPHDHRRTGTRGSVHRTCRCRITNVKQPLRRYCSLLQVHFLGKKQEILRVFRTSTPRRGWPPRGPPCPLRFLFLALHYAVTK